MDTIFDVGEIGWSMYHRAHLHWRLENGINRKVTVWTLPDRLRVFTDTKVFCINTGLPYEMITHSLIRNSFLYNNGPNIREIFDRLEINPYDVIHGWNNLDWKTVDCYKDMMVFKPFSSEARELEKYYKRLGKNLIDTERENIVICPRFKAGSPYMEMRNWGKQNWSELLRLLVDKTDYNIIICGKYGEAYHLGEQYGRSVDLIDSLNPFEYFLSALNDNKTVLCITSQGFGGKLALMQNVDTIMWGHQKQRHQVDENWSTDGETECSFIEDMKYESSPGRIFKEVEKVLSSRHGSKDRKASDCTAMANSVL